MIKFNCEKCGQRLSVPETRAGKKGRCPNCKNIIVIPENQIIDLLADQNDTGIDDPWSKNPSDNAIFQEIINKDQTQNESLGFSSGPEKDSEYKQESEEGSSNNAELPPERKLVWFLDIFLYPICLSGLTTMVIVIIIPLVIDLFAGLLGPFGFFVSIPGMFINFVISMYFLWYFTECIRDSAEGGIRAPETMANAPSLGELFSHLLCLLITILIYAGPAGIYYIKTDRTDTIFWALLGFAIFFLPIALLAVTLFDSLRGLNPLLLIGSVFSTHFIYLALVIILWTIALGVRFILRLLENELVAFLSGYLVLYILLVVAHLLGRFYFRFQEKLNWDV